MIPRNFIAQWRASVPWRSEAQVEQDLIISRALVEIFSDDFLRENLAFRGGTALHKFYLNPAPRYSEDIDLVQIKEGPVKPILQAIDKRINFFEEPRVVRPKANNNTILYRFSSEDTTPIRLRLKVEINCREHFSVLGFEILPFKVSSEWFVGEANITTYKIDELLGTKLRALYQRKKGRDLFDLFYADQHHKLDHDMIHKCYEKYMKFSVGSMPSQKEFAINMEEKKNDTDFAGDLEGLLRPDMAYNQTAAFDWLFENIVTKIK